MSDTEGADHPVTASPSVRDLEPCAAKHLAHYTDPQSGRAFHAYDRVGDPDRIEPTDVLAPALLDAPLRGRQVITMFGGQDAWGVLLDALQGVVADDAASTARIEDVDFKDEGGPWSLVRRALVASDSTPGVKASKVTKILHRKRPLLVPIFDRLVAEFFGVSTWKPADFWPIAQAEVREHREWLADLASGIRTAEDEVVSPLRVLDIVVWEHQQGCNLAD